MPHGSRRPHRPLRAPSGWGRRVLAAVVATAAAIALPVSLADAASAAPAPAGASTGFTAPYSGAAPYVSFAPTIAKSSIQVNQPLGRKRADALALSFGLNPKKVLTPKQYAQFISAQGKGGGTKDARTAAYLVDAGVRYLTNTTATKMYRNINGVPTRILLGSYGLIVNKEGLLESPANDTSPVRIVNWVLAPDAVCRFSPTPPPAGIPCGYMGKWMRKNGARDTLANLYASAYSREVPYGSLSQAQAEPHELVPNRRPDGSSVSVGMSMAPAIWVVNFCLIYVLNPRLAANMPAYWTPIPTEVSDAIYASETGQVPYADYMKYFPEDGR